MSDQPQYGDRMSRALALNYVLKHPVAFREYVVQESYRRRIWHRLSFTPMLLAMDFGDSLLAAGRGTGKSLVALEPELVRHAISNPGEESMITTLRRLHLVDRMERVIDYFDMPLFASWVKKIWRQPSYIIQLKNDHTIYGLAVGDDPEAKNAQGKHVSLLVGEEFQLYPLRAWLKLQGAKDPRGCRVFLVGVPDGRIDTPFRLADTKLDSFVGRRTHISRRTDPYWDQKTKQEKIDHYGSEEADSFVQDVDAEWGSPSWSAWDLDSIQRCRVLGETPPWWPHEISGKQYKENKYTPEVACLELPRISGEGFTVVAMDVGYSQPSEIGVFRRFRGSTKWRWIVRVKLTNKMEHDDQAAILDEICKRYDAEYVGIDATEGEGRAIATVMEMTWGAFNPEIPAYGQSGRVHRVSSNENIIASYIGQEPVLNTCRQQATLTLREMFGRHEFEFYVDEDIVTEFNSELESRSADGVARIKTPPTVHITDMMRVLAITLFRLNPPVMPAEITGEDVEPEWNVAGNPWQGSSVGALY